MAQKERTARYLATAKGEAATMRKRANQNAKRQAASAAHQKQRKPKQIRITLPVEHVSIVLPVEHLIAEASSKPKPAPVPAPEPQPPTGEQASLRNKARKLMEGIDDLLICEQSDEVGKLMFWLYGKYGFTMFEKPTDVSKEAEADRQAKWRQVELEMLARWKKEELDEMEEEYRCSLIRIQPFWEMVSAAVTWDAVERIVKLLQREASKDHKKRRNAFEARIPTSVVKTPETRKPTKRIRAINRTDVELMDFITKRLVTHAFLLAKAKSPDR
ncbi:MAG: hypothetical protein ACLPH5_04615 [Candidatus Sulfotelmatobacter sp.]